MICDAHLYHAAPLHYLPHILGSGALYAKSVLAGQGIAPRTGAARRDRMLGLADWVHLSLTPHTPLLRDKLQRGYAHGLLVFDRDTVLSLPEVALLPYNTKAWRSRAVFEPVTDPAEKAALLKRHAQTRRYPSLEVLVHYGLSLNQLILVGFAVPSEQEAVTETLTALNLPALAPLVTDPALFPLPDAYLPTTLSAIHDYFAACRNEGALLPPPAIPFD